MPASPGVTVDIVKGFFLEGQVVEQLNQDDVFQYIGKIAGMIAVSVAQHGFSGSESQVLVGQYATGWQSSWPVGSVPGFFSQKVHHDFIKSGGFLSMQPVTTIIHHLELGVGK